MSSNVPRESDNRRRVMRPTKPAEMLGAGWKFLVQGQSVLARRTNIDVYLACGFQVYDGGDATIDEIIATGDFYVEAADPTGPAYEPPGYARQLLRRRRQIVGRSCRPPRRLRQRRSHRRVVAKPTARGDSGDDGPAEPPGKRRHLTAEVAP